VIEVLEDLSQLFSKNEYVINFSLRYYTYLLKIELSLSKD